MGDKPRDEAFEALFDAEFERSIRVARRIVGDPDIASALGVSPGSVKTHLHRGVAALRRTLGNSLEEAHLVIEP